MKKLLFLFLLSFLVACSGGSSSGGAVEPTVAGNMIPANFIGTYQGVVNWTAQALGIQESGSFPITITVMSNGMIRFDGDSPDETFTVGITNQGNFSGSYSLDEDPCSGLLNVVGVVDGTTATGTVFGEGECESGLIKVDVSLTGSFSATK